MYHIWKTLKNNRVKMYYYIIFTFSDKKYAITVMLHYGQLM